MSQYSKRGTVIASAEGSAVGRSPAGADDAKKLAHESSKRAAPLAAAQAAIVASVDEHLRWNVAAYGTPWTQEYDDTEFLCNGAAEKAIAAYLAAGGTDVE